MKKLFIDDIRTPEMVYNSNEAKGFIMIRNYADFVKYIKRNEMTFQNLSALIMI